MSNPEESTPPTTPGGNTPPLNSNKPASSTQNSPSENFISKKISEGDVPLSGLRHPFLKDFLKQHPYCDEDTADRAFLIFQDLTEVKAWWLTDMGYSESLCRPYVIGRRTRHSERQIVIPLGAEETVSLAEIQHMFVGITIEGVPQKDVTLAINDLDSTTVYYKLTSGLCPPDAPEVVAKKRVERDMKFDMKRRRVARCVRMANDRLSGLA